MIDVGRIVMKLSGRDGGKLAVVVDKVDKNFVLIDGQTRRKKCNLLHLEPLDKIVDIKKNATHEDVKKAFKELGITIEDRKTKQRRERQRPAIKEQKTEKEQKPEKDKKSKK